MRPLQLLLEKNLSKFSEVLSLDVHFSPVLMPFFFLQSFSRDHTGFFFSSETKKKLSSELSALKVELGLCQAEMEAERQMHQKEEKALRARVAEAEKQRDAAI